MMLTEHLGICTAAIGAICPLAAGCGNDHSADKVPMAPVYSAEGNALVLEGGTYEGEGGTVSLLTSASGDLNGDSVGDEAHESIPKMHLSRSRNVIVSMR